MNIDFHAHFLPKADHGSDSVETSLRQLALAQEAEIDVLAATPHFYPKQDNAEAFLERRKACYAELCQQWTGKKPILRLGAEVHLCRGLEHLPELRQLCLQGTDLLLLELPGDFRMSTYLSTLEALLYDCKIRPILAHVDRYSADTIESLFHMGFLGQLNASSLCRFFGRKQRLRWIEEGHIVALGSDLHGIKTGYTEFLQVRKQFPRHYATIMERCGALLYEGAK